MYVIGENLSMNAVKNFMIRVWNFVTLPNMYYNEEGYFIIKFTSEIDRDLVMRKGPYTIHRKPMFLHHWTPDFTLEKDMIRTLPIWITLPQLPLAYWGER